MFAIAAVGSSKNMTPNRENARSWPGGSWACCRVGAHQLDIRETELGASLRARASIGSEMSTPRTAPDSPTCHARAIVVAPQPHPMSIARSPGRGDTVASPRSPSGSSMRSSCSCLATQPGPASKFQWWACAEFGSAMPSTVSAAQRSWTVRNASRPPNAMTPRPATTSAVWSTAGADPPAKERHAAREEQEPAEAARADPGEEGGGRGGRGRHIRRRGRGEQRRPGRDRHRVRRRREERDPEEARAGDCTSSVASPPSRIRRADQRVLAPSPTSTVAPTKPSTIRSPAKSSNRAVPATPSEA